VPVLRMGQRLGGSAVFDGRPRTYADVTSSHVQTDARAYLARASNFT